MNVLYLWITAGISAGIAAGGIAFGGYHYHEIHLPAFTALEAEILYDKCLRECQEICAINGIPADECRCEAFCKGKYLLGD